MADPLERTFRRARVGGAIAVLLALLLLGAAAPRSAQAATAGVTNGVLVYRAGPGVVNTLEVSGPFCFSPIPGPCPPADIRFRLLDFGGPFGRPGGEVITPLPGCVAGAPEWGGREAYCSSDVTSLDIDLADRDDWVDATGILRPAIIRGGTGNDQLRDGAVNDTVLAGPGNDTFFAKPGNDQLRGEDGADVYYALFCELVCRPLTDTQRETGSDTFSGGGGRDTADFSDVFAAERLSADGTSDDGKPNEGDNIGTDVEDILAGPLSDRVVGNARDNQLDGGDGNDVMEGGGGRDVLQGRAGADALRGGIGPDTLSGGAGRDSASYSDRGDRVVVTVDGRANDGEPGEDDSVGLDVEDVLGGRGADDLTGSTASNRLDGGAGEDYLDGARGVDTLVGGGASDLVRLRDGAGETGTSCGSGPDFVIADARDRTSRDCEDVDDVPADRPVLGSRVAVQPGAAALQMQLPVAHRFVPLMDHVNAPVGAIFDTVKGRARVTSRVSRRKRQRGVFARGIFQVLQSRRGRARGLTELRLKGGSFAGCARGSRAGARTAQRRRSKRVVRRLRANGRGRFRTRGRYSAATVRGTAWEMTDRCDGTLTRVRRGRVAVRDFRLKRTVLLRQGKRYLARAR